jgi:glutamate/tyrosine decarboxylase-like PLP-dependent enzyme
MSKRPRPTGDGPAPSPFEWTAEEIRRVGHRVADLIADHLGELPAGPVFRPVPAALADALVATPVPERGEPAERVLDRFGAEIAPYPFGNGHPRFYGWVNPPPAPIAVFAAALAAALNPSVAGGNHGSVWLERQVVEWFKQLLGFPRDAAGLLVSGGSAAAITALAVARYAACVARGWDVRAAGLQGVEIGGRPVRLLVYQSPEGHSCHQKAVELLGLGSAHLRTVPCDAALRMVPEALDRMLREDLARGDLPLAVVASAGTVNTGAVDPLGPLAEVCARHRVWLHVDAAYGAPAILSGAHRAALAPLARADSVAVDPHKWLYVPVDAGLVLVKDAGAMRDAFSLVPPYLRSDDDVHGVHGPPWFSEYGAEQTRPFRALKVWAALRYFGLEGYRALVEHDLALARRLAALVREAPELELWEPQGLSIVCFRAKPPALRGDAEAEDRLNRAVLREVQLGGKCFLSSTVLGGRFWLRACVVNPRATERDVETVLGVVREAVKRALRLRNW